MKLSEKQMANIREHIEGDNDVINPIAAETIMGDLLDTIDALRRERDEAVALAVAGAYLAAALTLKDSAIGPAGVYSSPEALYNRVIALTPADAQAALAAHDTEIKNYYEAILAMTVSRLGGIVEWGPTHRGNFLQRIDELVRIEKRDAEKDATIARLQAELACPICGIGKPHFDDAHGASVLPYVLYGVPSIAKDFLVWVGSNKNKALMMADFSRNIIEYRRIDAAEGGHQP